MLKLKAAPTFKAKVSIPVPGAQPEEIEFEYRHMTRSAFEDFRSPERAAGRSDVDTVMEIACGWDNGGLPFTRESLTEFFENYHGAPFVIADKYGRELTQARLGN